LAASFAAVVGDRGEPGELADGLARQRADLGQPGHQPCHGAPGHPLASVSWRRRVTRAASCCWGALAGGRAAVRVTAAYQAMTPASMRSVFSSRPMASAKRRTARGLTIAAATPCAQSR